MTAAASKIERETTQLPDELRARTLARFEKHRRAWQKNRSLRTINADLYAQVARQLPPQTLGRRIELGSGPGFAREFIPGIELTDLVRAPWHDGEASAEALPYEAGSIGALVLFDVLHHVPSPRKFFDEAVRVLVPGGRVVMCEPYISPVSYPVYKFLHEEPLDMSADPLALHDRGRRTRSVRFEPGDSDAVVRTEAPRIHRGVSGAFDSVHPVHDGIQPPGDGRVFARAVSPLCVVVAVAPPRRAGAVGADALDGVSHARRAGTGLGAACSSVTSRSGSHRSAPRRGRRWAF